MFDGVLETPGRITFMTTNFIDKLDKAFTRPGRIDVISKFGFADDSQIVSIIEHRYDATLTPEQLSFIYNLNQCITPAEISRILFENFDNLDGALKGLENYITEYNLFQTDKEAKEQEFKNKVLMLEMEATNETKVDDTTQISVLDELTPTQQQFIELQTMQPQPITEMEHVFDKQNLFNKHMQCMNAEITSKVSSYSHEPYVDSVKVDGFDEFHKFGGSDLVNSEVIMPFNISYV